MSVEPRGQRFLRRRDHIVLPPASVPPATRTGDERPPAASLCKEVRVNRWGRGAAICSAWYRCSLFVWLLVTEPSYGGFL